MALSNNNLKNLDKLPPIDVLFGDFNFKGKTNHLLFQKVGSVTTAKPLLTFVEKSNGVKNAYFIGEGLWRWRLHEFAQHENSDGIDELIQKTVRYITTKKDKRQLRVNPTKEEFFSDESVLFDVEVIFFYPYAVNFRELGWAGYSAVLMFVGFFLVGFIYIIKKGALTWED